MLSLSTIKGGAAYYAAEENYYAMGELESSWIGEGADRLGLSGPVDGATLDAIAQGKLPDGTELSHIVNGKQTHRSGYDITFSAPKSVSVMALVVGDERFLAAHQRAVSVAMKEVEALASTRIMTDGVSRTEATGNIVAALYTHDTSRELDPQLHTHSLVFNATFADGKWRAMASDTKTNNGFYEAMLSNQIALGKVYRHALRQDIEAMGFETAVVGKHGMWELKDVPVEPFSQRSQQINEAVGPDASPKSRDVAALDTRKEKAVADPDLLIADWRSRLNNEGFDQPLYLANAAERALEHRAIESSPQDIQQAVSQAISLLSDKKVQFSYSELLSATISQLPTEAGLVKAARDGIDQAITNERLIPLDKEKGVFTSDIHLLNELSVSQLAKELNARPPVATFPHQAQERDRSYSDAYSVLAQDKSPIAILSGRGGMSQTIERMEDAVLMTREQGREIMILASDNRSARLLTESPSLAGSITPRHALTANTVFPPHSTLVVEQAETMTLKESLLLLEKARAGDIQLLLLDSERNSGVGNALSVLKQADVPQYRFYDSPKIEAAVVSEPDKAPRFAALAHDYVSRLHQGDQVFAQVSGARDQQQLTSEIRSALRSAGELKTPDVSLNVLSPVWLDSKTRYQRDTYRPGMVMERWDDQSKTMHRYSIDLVADKTHSLVLINEQGEKNSIRIRSLDSNWSLFETKAIDVSVGDTLRVLGREAQGELKAQQTLTVTDIAAHSVRVATPSGDMALATDRALKLDHNYVTGIGTTVSKDATVLAALSARQMTGTTLNQLARSGQQLRLYTPLSQDKAEKKLVSHPQFQLASEKVKAHGQSDQLDAALKQATNSLFTPAEQAIHLGLAQMEARDGIVFSTPDLLSAALDFAPSTPVDAISTALELKLAKGDLIPVPGKSGNVVARASFEMEKAIISTIAEGKGASSPYMNNVPSNLLEGLTPGQADATRLILESDDQFVAIQGYAGVGKTTQFKAVLSALDTLPVGQRPNVIGIGPTHRAVHEMQENGVKAQTLASFLSESRQLAMAGETPDHSNTLFLVDESSMIGNRDMAEFYQRVAASGARIISSGDTAQLKAISSGAPFKLMQERSAVDVAVMKDIVRQRPELKPAIYSLIEGNLAQSLIQREAVQPTVVPRDQPTEPDAWTPDRSVIESDNPAQLVVKDYVSRTRIARDNTMVIVHLNKERHDINSAIHQSLFDKGELGSRQTTITILDPVRIEENSLRSTSQVSGNNLKGKIAVVDQKYYTLTDIDEKSGTMTLIDDQGKQRIISNNENTAHDLAIYQPIDIKVSEGDKIRFTRTVNEHGHVANSQWQIKRIEDNGSIILSDGSRNKTLHPGKYQEDQHIDLGYAITSYGSQGASSTYEIELQDVSKLNKNMVTLASAYVPASRAKEHIQTYTNSKKDWQDMLNKSMKKQVHTAHDALSTNQGKGQRLADELMKNASPMRATALGRSVLKTHSLDEQLHMGKYIAPGKKYPTPHAALPTWDNNGKQTGAAMIELRSNSSDKGPTLSKDYRLVSSEDAQFIGLQRSKNGQTVISSSLYDGLKIAAEHPESGVLVSINGEKNPYNLHRMTGGKVLVSDVDRVVPSTDEERTITLPEDKKNKEEKREEEIIKALAKEKQDTDIKLPKDHAHDDKQNTDRIERDIRNLDQHAELSERQLREIAAIKDRARTNFKHELDDKLDRLERDIVKELTRGE